MRLSGGVVVILVNIRVLAAGLLEASFGAACTSGRQGISIGGDTERPLRANQKAGASGSCKMHACIHAGFWGCMRLLEIPQGSLERHTEAW